MFFIDYFMNCCLIKKNNFVEIYQDDSILFDKVDLNLKIENSDILFDNNNSTIYKLNGYIYKKHIPYKKKKYLDIINELKNLNNSLFLIPLEIFGTNSNYIIEKLNYVSNGDLLEYIMTKKLSFYEKNIIIKKLLKIIKDLHNYGYSHRDLKPENILIDNNQDLILADFDFTCRYNCNDNFNSGTLKYAAPEIIKYNELKLSDWRKIDIWSLGIILYIILLDRFPWIEATIKSNDFKNYTTFKKKNKYFKEILKNKYANYEFAKYELDRYSHILSHMLSIIIDNRYDINLIEKLLN